MTHRLVVAADSPEITAVARQFGFEATLTSPDHPSGTDRVAEVAARPEFADFEAILNVQGDAPFLPLAALAGALRQIRFGFDLGTAAVPLDPAARDDLSRVKVAVFPDGEALGFSRVPIPGTSNWLHLGVYAYTRPALLRLAGSAPTESEASSGLEQLRAEALGLRIGVALLHQPAGPAVDTEADLQEAETHWNTIHEVIR